MTQADIYLELGALADGELDAARCATLQARLASDPALSRTLENVRALNAAAKNERVPECCAAQVGLWPLIAQRELSFSPAGSQQLKALANSEASPSLNAARAAVTWKNVRGRALHAFDEDHFHHAVPEVPRENWDQAWKFISTRTRLSAISMPAVTPLKIVKPEPQIKAVAPKPARWSAWSWGAGVGLAAAAMLTIVFSTPENPPPPDAPSLVNSMAMSIPESQDERYGVLVKYVPGSDDPIICLYDKRSGAK